MWAQDFLAEHQADHHIINDSWTPSGPMHIGSFRSLVIHDVLRRVLEDEKKPVTYFYGYDDYDPMDGIPPGFEGFEEHLGKPLVNIPARSKGYPSFADEFIAENKHNHQVLGVKAGHYRTSELYRTGKFNSAISRVLDSADKIRQIYLEVSGSKRPADWYPLQVICPNCGKLGSTYVNGWDGREVSFECRKDLVPWAKGCGYQGRTSPYDGAGKMHWRVEWAAKWDLFGVTIEAAGKDHANKGGSFDTGQRILREVFGKGPIAAFGHEFFLLDGKKMGSTKSRISPADALEVLTPETLRFLLVRTRPNQAIEISLSKIVPPTYDEYDRCQRAYLEKTTPDLADYFYFSQINPTRVDGLVKERFSTVVNLIQLPSMKQELERPEVAPRVEYARAWLKKYASETMRAEVKGEIPETANLSARMGAYYAKLSEAIPDHSGEELQREIREISSNLEIPMSVASAGTYSIFTGETSGPRLASFLDSVKDEKGIDFAIERLKEAAKRAGYDFRTVLNK